MSDSQVWKFPLAAVDIAEVEMPEGAEVLCVQVQAGDPMLWALVAPEAPTVTRRFRVAGTGHLVGDVGRYIGTFQLFGGGFIGHVWEMP